ncbi:MAG: tetratricopeptide repeat protein, partial [Wenzhouxiangella sp.]
ASEGLSTDARWTVGQALARYPHHAELNEQFERLLISSGNDSELRSHLDRRLHKLALDRNDTKAIEAWLRSREMLGDWMPSSSEARHRIGLALTKAGQHRDALKLLLSVRTNNPNYDLMPEACLRAAQIMETFMGDAVGADKLRAAVRRRYPGRAEYWERHGDPR